MAGLAPLHGLDLSLVPESDKVGVALALTESGTKASRNSYPLSRVK